MLVKTNLQYEDGILDRLYLGIKVRGEGVGDGGQFQGNGILDWEMIIIITNENISAPLTNICK